MAAELEFIFAGARLIGFIFMPLFTNALPQLRNSNQWSEPSEHLPEVR